jgi:hypothetical protein
VELRVYKAMGKGNIHSVFELFLFYITNLMKHP